MSIQDPTYKQYLDSFSRKIKKELNRITKNKSKATLKDLRILLNERMTTTTYIRTKFTKLFLFHNQEFQIIIRLLNTNEGKHKLFKGMEIHEHENLGRTYY